MKKKITVLFFVFLALGLFVRLYKTASLPFYDWDEGIYAQVAKEILKNRSLDTTFNGHIWLNKPPLSHLLIALSFAIFGFSELYARAIFTIFGIATLILLYLFSKKLLSKLSKPSLSLSLLPSLVLASTPIFLERATTLNTDIIIAASYLGYFLFLDNFPVKTLFLLLGVYSKSLVGFFPLFIEPILWLQKKLDFKTLFKNLLMLLLQIFLASLWYIYAFSKYGNYFVKAHFMDQIFKRVVAPIELHFGNKWYYFNLLWENLNWPSLVLAVSLFAIAVDFIKLVLKRRFSSVKNKSFVYFAILLSPLAFFALLVVGKSKIYWYLLFILPLFLLSFPYLLSKLSKPLSTILIAVISIFSFFKFTNQTYLFKPKIEINDKIKLAKCIKRTNGKSLAFLVDENERKIKNVLEAAHLQTETSFIYGGSPSFVFYVDKEKFTYFYDVNKFLNDASKYDLLAISQQDYERYSKHLKNFTPFCKISQWLALQRKTSK